MKFDLNYSQRKISSRITRALPFKYSLEKLSEDIKFPIKTICDQDLVKLSRKLDSKDDIFFGNKKFVGQEINRIKRLGQKENVKSLLLGFPFKCPVPAKTGYNYLPNLGEVMFLQRLNRLSRYFEILLRTDFSVLILEETDTLSPVFDVSEEVCSKFRKRLFELNTILGFDNVVTFKHLSTYLSPKKDQYRNDLQMAASKIKHDRKKYLVILRDILPTIALSLNSSKLSVKGSCEDIIELFSNSVSPELTERLLDTAYKYIAFTELQKSSEFRRKNFDDFLQMTLTPKKGRVGIAATLSETGILPHHGVPVVYYDVEGKEKFTIEYYCDFLQENSTNVVYEVRNGGGNFLYYSVLKLKEI